MAWEDLVGKSFADVAPYLSIRGKNLAFFEVVVSALQFDQVGPPKDLRAFKRAITPNAVRTIFEALPALWPGAADLERLLRTEGRRVSGLYVGNYEPDILLGGITRHSLYADRLLLIDPLPFPTRVRPEFSPILHPEQYQSTTLKWLLLWFTLHPWIDAGLVGFIRSPGDFDGSLDAQAYDITERRYAANPEFKRLTEEEIKRPDVQAVFEKYERQFALSMPDEAFLRWAKRDNPNWDQETLNAALAYIKRARDESTYLVRPFTGSGGGAEIIQFSSGASYEMAKIIAAMSGSFLLTDFAARWREIELDRAENGIDPQRWSPFAKAFQEVPFHYLNNVPLATALTLRTEERLETLRGFLRKTWRLTAGDKPYDSANATELTAELTEKIREAEAEWKKIDGALLRWVGSGVALGAGPAIATGQAAWLGGAAVSAITQLVWAAIQRSNFDKRYPAAFFLRLQRGQDARS